MDVKVMNICLLCKWLERLERGDSSIYVELLRRKYLGEQSIFQQKKKEARSSGEIFYLLGTGTSREE